MSHLAEKVSTSTIIISTNIEFNLDWLYYIIPLYQFSYHGKCKTSREFHEYITSLNPPTGIITMIQHKERLRGFKIHKRQNKYFRNALSLVMFADKLITVKIPKKGKLQFTGCTSEDQAKTCLRYIWDFLKTHPQSELTYRVHGDRISTIIRTVMTDIVFSVGFNINRQKLDIYMNQQTEYNSLLETSFGYTGVNIKIPYEIDFDARDICTYSTHQDEWVESYMSFNEYLTTITSKERDKEIDKSRKNTFLVFHSGKAIMSGMNIKYMRQVYHDFVQLMIRARPSIEEFIHN